MSCSTPECEGYVSCCTLEPESRLVLALCAECATIARIQGLRVKMLHGRV